MEHKQNKFLNKNDYEDEDIFKIILQGFNENIQKVFKPCDVSESYKLTEFSEREDLKSFHNIWQETGENLENLIKPLCKVITDFQNKDNSSNSENKDLPNILEDFSLNIKSIFKPPESEQTETKTEDEFGSRFVESNNLKLQLPFQRKTKIDQKERQNKEIFDKRSGEVRDSTYFDRKLKTKERNLLMIFTNKQTKVNNPPVETLHCSISNDELERIKAKIRGRGVVTSAGVRQILLDINNSNIQDRFISQVDSTGNTLSPETRENLRRRSFVSKLKYEEKELNKNQKQRRANSMPMYQGTIITQRKECGRSWNLNTAPKRKCNISSTFMANKLE